MEKLPSVYIYLQQKKDLLKAVAIVDMQLLTAQVCLADFIAGNRTNLDQVYNKVGQLTNPLITLLKEDKNSNSDPIRAHRRG